MFIFKGVRELKVRHKKLPQFVNNLLLMAIS